MTPEFMLVMIPTLPLLASLFLFVSGRHSSMRSVAILGYIGPFLAFWCALGVFDAYVSGTAEDGVLPSINVLLWHWIGVPEDALGLSAPFSLVADKLSALLVLMVTGVGTLIHFYSTRYMREDHNVQGVRDFSRYFAFLNLFTGMMLILLLADNLLVMFIGWEGVGLCSYFLIGFGFKNRKNAKAAQKAFVVNRIGDAAFIVGIVILLTQVGSVHFNEINLAAQNPVSLEWMTVAAILLFIGAIGKSAQIPLFIWLPDAMAGPTPVSALIHAATMVTSGVYMVARLEGLFQYSMEWSWAGVTLPLGIIALVGALTALLAATIAITQHDIKKVLAYSTISQLGYMFMGLGLMATAPAIYHLVTHAFFKALLFLAAGSVIVALHHKQDMRDMGGLFERLPVTGICFWVGVLALAGFPLVSGFYSKEAILGEAWNMGWGLGSPIGKICFVVGMVTALLTAIYSFRLIALVFHGTPRNWGCIPREPGGPMGFALIVLAIFSVVGGTLLHDSSNLRNLDVYALLGKVPLGHDDVSGWVLGIAMIVLLLGMVYSIVMYWIAPQFKTRFKSEKIDKVKALSRNGWYIDHALCFLGELLEIGANLLRDTVEGPGIDGFYNKLGRRVRELGNQLKTLQVGLIRAYATFLAIGTIGALAIIWVSMATPGEVSIAQWISVVLNEGSTPLRFGVGMIFFGLLAGTVFYLRWVWRKLPREGGTS